MLHRGQQCGIPIAKAPVREDRAVNITTKRGPRTVPQTHAREISTARTARSQTTLPGAGGAGGDRDGMFTAVGRSPDNMNRSERM